MTKFFSAPVIVSFFAVLFVPLITIAAYLLLKIYYYCFITQYPGENIAIAIGIIAAYGTAAFLCRRRNKEAMMEIFVLLIPAHTLLLKLFILPFIIEIFSLDYGMLC